MKAVPFYANTPDDTHCVQAAFKMMLKFFIPERDFSFAELDEMSRKRPGKGTWWPALLLELSKLGIKVKDIEPFDYERFYREGEPYVRSFYPGEAARYHIDRTNLKDLKPVIPEFLANVAVERRAAKLGDIQKLLDGGWLVAAAVNSRVLNGRPGFAGHVVVVFGRDELSGDFRLHDPGLPPLRNAQVPRTKFAKAFNSAGAEQAALAAVKRA